METLFSTCTQGNSPWANRSGASPEGVNHLLSVHFPDRHSMTPFSFDMYTRPFATAIPSHTGGASRGRTLSLPPSRIAMAQSQPSPRPSKQAKAPGPFVPVAQSPAQKPLVRARRTVTFDWPSMETVGTSKNTACIKCFNLCCFYKRSMICKPIFAALRRRNGSRHHRVSVSIHRSAPEGQGDVLPTSG